jgi:hypothetical protein
MSAADAWKHIITSAACKRDFPETYKLICAVSIMVLRTVDCERAVSVVNLIKTDKCNNLSIEHTDALVRLKHAAQSGDEYLGDVFDYLSAYEHFLSGASKRGRYHAPTLSQLPEEWKAKYMQAANQIG